MPSHRVSGSSQFQLPYEWVALTYVVDRLPYFDAKIIEMLYHDIHKSHYRPYTEYF